MCSCCASPQGCQALPRSRSDFSPALQSVFLTDMQCQHSVHSRTLHTPEGEALLLHCAVWSCFKAPWHVGILQTCLGDHYVWCLTLECKDQTAMNTSWAILLKRRVLSSWWHLRQVNLLIVDTHKHSLGKKGTGYLCGCGGATTTGVHPADGFPSITTLVDVAVM